VLTKKISGTPAAVIRTPYIDKQGLELNPLEEFLLKNGLTKKYTKMARSLWGAYILQKAAKNTTWKEVWSAGQGVGLIQDVLPAAEIVQRLMREYRSAKIPS
jgi:nitronate monooxygenase